MGTKMLECIKESETQSLRSETVSKAKGHKGTEIRVSLFKIFHRLT